MFQQLPIFTKQLTQIVCMTSLTLSMLTGLQLLQHPAGHSR